MELAAIIPMGSKTVVVVVSPCVDQTELLVTKHFEMFPLDATVTVVLFAHVRRFRLLSSNSPLSFPNYETAVAACETLQRSIGNQHSGAPIPPRVLQMILADGEHQFEETLVKYLRGLTTVVREVVCPLPPLNGRWSIPGLKNWRSTLAERLESALYHGNVVAPLTLPSRSNIIDTTPEGVVGPHKVLLFVDTGRLFLKLPQTVLLFQRLLGSSCIDATIVGQFTAPPVAMSAAAEVTGGGPSMESVSWSDQYRAAQALAADAAARVRAAVQAHQGSSLIEAVSSSEDIREQILAWKGKHTQPGSGVQLTVLVERRMLGGSVILSKSQQWWRSYVVRSVLDRLLVEFGDEITFCIA